MAPFPGGWKENSRSALFRVIPLTLASPCLVADAAKQFFPIVFLVVALTAATLGCISVVLLTNLPLYAYDGYSSVKQRISPALPGVSNSYGRWFTQKTSQSTDAENFDDPLISKEFNI